MHVMSVKLSPFLVCVGSNFKTRLFSFPLPLEEKEIIGEGPNLFGSGL